MNDVPLVFEGPTLTFPDGRKDYGEVRAISVGLLRGRMVIVVWTERDEKYRIISMRKANDREQEIYRDRLD